MDIMENKVRYFNIGQVAICLLKLSDKFDCYNNQGRFTKSIHEYNPRSIIPSDYCYNRINDGIDFES